ncbi:MAG TPA: hypothetical protein VJ183_08925, partial [Chloroflexia bacterium]|nr:hypothetical protein [Chloroflexia bacterium]
MSTQTERTGRIRPILVLIALLLGALLTGSVAMAGLPTGNHVGSLPTNQDQSANAPVQQQQPEDPAKGTQAESPPATLYLMSGAQQPVGGTPPPTPCGPSSIYFELEPNNTITTAHVLGSKFDAEVRGAINSAGDVDYYSFVANAGDRIWAYAFTLGAVSSTDTQLQLLNALSQTLQFDDDNGSQADLSSAIAGKVVTQTATYYLRVNAFSSTSTINPYTLFIDRTETAPVPEIEPNETFTQPNAYVMDSVVTGTIATTGDLDVYSFEFNDDDRYVFQVDGDPERDGSEFDPNYDLMNTAGAVLVTVDSDSQFDVREVNSENSAFFIDTGGPPTATLLLRIRTDNDGGGTATGTYNLHIWRVGEIPCGNTQTPTVTNTPTPVCNTFLSEIEPNSTFTTAQTLPTLNNLQIGANITPAGDIDYFTGNATAGDKIWAYLFTGSSTSGADTELRILNSVSTTIEFDDDNGSQTAASSGIAGAPITTTGAIYFRANEFNNDGTVTGYSLFIDRTSSTPNVTEIEPNDVYTQANMVTVGDLITGTIAITSDLDVYGFTATAGDRIIFQADSDPERDGVQYNPNFQILDSAGVQLVAVDSDSTLGDRRSEHHVFTFGAAGTYYVRMSSDSSGPTTGSYNLHLWRTANPPCSSPTPVASATGTNTPVVPTATTTATSTTIAATNTVTSTNTVVAPTGTNTTVAASATATVCVPGAPIQETEPNNTIALANPVGTNGAEVRGGITPAGDQDFFSFSANAGDRIWSYINTSNAAPSTDSILTLFNALTGTIQLDDDNGFQSTLSSAIAGGVITQTGTHALQVRQFGGATVMSPYSLYIDKTSGAAIPETEPNNSFLTANAYAFGTVVTGSIPITTDVDYYTFTLAQNDKVVIQVDGDPDRNGTNLTRTNQFNPNFALLDSTGAIITLVDSDSQGGNGGLLSESLVFTNTSAISTTFGVLVQFDPSTPVEDDTGIYNLHLFKVGGGTCGPSATPVATNTVGPTNTAGAATSTNTVVAPTATCVAQAAGWTLGAPFNAAAVVRGTGVYFPNNGNFYVMGGRTSDTAGSDLTNVHGYVPSTNTWFTDSDAPYPDNQINNMVCGVLTVSGIPQIYCVGGSAAGATTSTARVFSYNPSTNTITSLPAADNWPGNSSGGNLPGGFAVFQNKLYIIGGFTISPAAAMNTIYQFDPTLASGSRWTLKTSTLPVAMAYVPATTIGTLIYTGGGATVSAGVLTDSTNAYVYNPVADTISPITNIPRATGETRAVTVAGEMWVLGGGRTSPNPSNQVDIYNTTTGWRVGLPFSSTRRNLAADTDGTRVWIAGGYTGAAPGTPVNTLDIYSSGVVCATGTATTVAATSTNTVGVATASATACSSNYTYTASAGATIVAGTVDIGNHGDDVITSVTLPFPYTVYDQVFTTVNVSSNGNLQFNSAITGLNDY